MFGHAQTQQQQKHGQVQKRIPNKQVKDMVKKMVLNLEQLQGNLQLVVGDLKALVDQIDSVTEKIDKTYGTKWRRDDNSPSSNPSNFPSKNPKRKTTNYDEVKQDRLRVEDVKTCDASPDLDLSYLHITPGEQRSRWGRSLIFSDPMHVSSNADRVPKRSLSLGTDMAEYSATTLHELSVSLQTSMSIRTPKRSISVNTDMTDNSGVSVQTCIPVPVAKCYAQIKNSVVKEEVTQSKQDVDNTSESKTTDDGDTDLTLIQSDSQSNTLNLFDIRTETNACATGSDIPYDLLNSKIVNVDSASEQGSPYSSEGYDGMYERLMETQLENMSASSDCTDLTESSEYNMDLGSLDKSDTSFSDDIEVRYDRDINTWTSYTLAHMNSSTRSSDSCLSETPSDILNDNTQATITYGNMIFSDQLVVLNSRKHRRKRPQRDQITNQSLDVP